MCIRDSSYSPEAIVTRANAELANSFGNLAQRTLSMIFKNMDGVLDVTPDEHPADVALTANVMEVCRVSLPAEFE